MSNVYFCDFKASDFKDSKVEKIKRLFQKAGFAKFLNKDDLTAIKIHFGERGNDAYINPVFVRQVVDKIKEAGAKPFVTDTNTLYSGERHNSVDHLTVALEHGFNYTVINAPVIIADGLRSKNFRNVEIDLKHFKTAKIAADIVDSDSMIVMSHVKGHPMAGFGGAVKNLAMGCAPAKGKEDQHSFRPTVDTQKCIACGKCIKVCPKEAISYKSYGSSKKAFIDKNICIGCGQCVSECPVKAISIEDENDLSKFVERIAEYALASVKGKEEKVGYINFLMNITHDCDCFPFSDASIVPDIGILASTDPIAIDMASVDLINQQLGFEGTRLKDNHKPGCDKFAGLRPDNHGMVQINYGEEIGLGSKKYKLIKV
ncbi:MAG: DUF362 domain-containing protein [Lactobacillus sp.]|nr:DUF362 domain-containing protein [Lactobacillus sp.]